jgi:hypothetical protein
MRKLYDECNLQVFTLITRTFTIENGGFTDASGSELNKGYDLWDKLVKFNYGVTVDNMPKLKMQFYDTLTFRQKHGESVDEWANKVRLRAQVLISNGHPITDQEKTLIFRSGLLNEEARNALIMPARTENYETLLHLLFLINRHMTGISTMCVWQRIVTPNPMRRR